LILCRADWAVWVLIPASRGIAITLHHRSMTSMQQTQYKGGEGFSAREKSSVLSRWERMKTYTPGRL